MTSVNKSAMLSYSAKSMYILVEDIERYPEFLPWCSSSVIHWRNDDEVKATLYITKAKLNTSFTTINKKQPYKRIVMELAEGPFKHLHGVWTFTPLKENACKVNLKMDFEFSNKLMGVTMGLVFNQIANTMLDAFCDRAKALYG